MKVYAHKNDKEAWVTPSLGYQPENDEYFGSVFLAVGPFEVGVHWGSNNEWPQYAG